MTATGDQADDLFWATLRIIDRSKRLKILAICRLKRKIENSTHFGILAFFNHSALWSCTGKFSLFREIGPQWPKLEPFPPLGPDFGMVLLSSSDFPYWISSCILLPLKTFFTLVFFVWIDWTGHQKNME